jgi:hypothetical protein
VSRGQRSSLIDLAEAVMLFPPGFLVPYDLPAMKLKGDTVAAEGVFLNTYYEILRKLLRLFN